MTPWTGYPPDPDVSGWHWLRLDGELLPAFWSMAKQEFRVEGAYRTQQNIQHWYSYIGPLPEPVVGGGEP